MALETWHVCAPAIPYAGMLSQADLFQASGGDRVIRVRRIWQFCSQITAVSGWLSSMRLRTISAASGGTTVTPGPHDSANAALPAQVTAGVQRTVTAVENMRVYTVSPYYVTANSAPPSAWQATVPGAEVWSVGYGDATLAPITCRNAEGVDLYHYGLTNVSQSDVEMEFTNEAP